MPKYCVAANCTNSSLSKSVFLFPSNEFDRNKWTKFVQVKRADFLVATKFSALCEDHFIEENFENKKQKELGFSSRLHLKKGAVSSVHAASFSCGSAHNQRKAVQKFELYRVSPPFSPHKFQKNK